MFFFNYYFCNTGKRYSRILRIEEIHDSKLTKTSKKVGLRCCCFFPCPNKKLKKLFPKKERVTRFEVFPTLYSVAVACQEVVLIRNRINLVLALKRVATKRSDNVELFLFFSDEEPS